MAARDAYLVKAAQLNARAAIETNHAAKADFQNIARAYLRLAEQAEHNTVSIMEIFYGVRPKKDRDWQ